MADRVFIDSGNDTPISTDYITRDGNPEHVQYVKLMSGIDGDSAVISGNSTYGIDVNIKNIGTTIPNITLSSQISPFTTPLNISGSNITINSLPSGNNIIGRIDGSTISVTGGSLSVNGTFYPAIQNISGSNINISSLPSITGDVNIVSIPDINVDGSSIMLTGLKFCHYSNGLQDLPDGMIGLYSEQYSTTGFMVGGWDYGYSLWRPLPMNTEGLIVRDAYTANDSKSSKGSYEFEDYPWYMAIGGLHYEPLEEWEPGMFIDRNKWYPINVTTGGNVVVSGDINIISMPSISVTGEFYPSIQNVSGSNLNVTLTSQSNPFTESIPITGYVMATIIGETPKYIAGEDSSSIERLVGTISGVGSSVYALATFNTDSVVLNNGSLNSTVDRVNIVGGISDNNVIQPIYMDSSGALYTQLIDSLGSQITFVDNKIPISLSGESISIDINGSTISVTGGSINQAGVWTVNTDIMTHGNHEFTNYETVTGVTMMWIDNTDSYRAYPVSYEAPMPIDGSLQGYDAVNTPIYGKPVIIGGAARSSEPSPNSDNYVTYLSLSKTGKIITSPYCLPADSKQYSGNITDNSDHILITGVALNRIYITHISVMNASSTVGTVVNITDGSDGSPNLYRGYAGINGGGFTSTFVVPLKGSVASGVNLKAITNGADLYVNINGYVSTQ